MAKRKAAPLTPGTHWRQTQEGWVPRFVWKKLVIEGTARPAQLLMPNEAFLVVMEFANAAGKAIFGVAPYRSVEDESGREVFAANPEFDELPDLKSVLGGLKAPGDIEIKASTAPQGPAPTTAEGIPLDQIDPDTMPLSE